MFDREPVISALHVPSRVPTACSAHTPGQRERHHAVATRHGGGNPGNHLGGHSKDLPASLPPQHPTPGPFLGHASQENMRFGMFLADPVQAARG